MTIAEGTLIERARRVFGGRIKENPTLGYFLDGRPINSIKLMGRVVALENTQNDADGFAE